MHFYFRVDANQLIGSGHYARCLSLAKFLIKNKKNVTFITKSIEIKNQNNLYKKNIPTRIFHSNDMLKDIKNTLNIIKNKKNAYLIIDDYKFSAKWQRLVKKKIKNLILINDYNSGLKDLIKINPSHFKSGFEKNILAAPLVDETYDNKNYLKNYKQLKNNYNIIISFGASDKQNYTKKICDIIDYKKFKKFNFKILIGKYYKYEKSLKQTDLYKKGRVSLIKNRNNLLHIFKRSRLAIVSGGVISRELINLGIPAIILKIADNQKFNINFYRKNKIFGIFEKKNLKKKKSSILNKLIIKKIDTSFNEYLNIISYSSTDVLNKTYYYITKSQVKKIFLRKTSIKDFIFLYSLVNQKKNRKYSFRKKRITIDGHNKWFIERLVNDGSNMFILEDQMGTRLGQLRLELFKNKYYLDYSIDEFFQNKGLGRKMINLLKTKQITNLPIYAKVLKDNIPSNKVFKNFTFDTYRDYNLFKIN